MKADVFHLLSKEMQVFEQQKCEADCLYFYNNYYKANDQPELTDKSEVDLICEVHEWFIRLKQRQASERPGNSYTEFPLTFNEAFTEQNVVARDMIDGQVTMIRFDDGTVVEMEDGVPIAQHSGTGRYVIGIDPISNVTDSVIRMSNGSSIGTTGIREETARISILGEPERSRGGRPTMFTTYEEAGPFPVQGMSGSASQMDSLREQLEEFQRNPPPITTIRDSADYYRQHVEARQGVHVRDVPMQGRNPFPVQEMIGTQREIRERLAEEIIDRYNPTDGQAHVLEMREMRPYQDEYVSSMVRVQNQMEQHARQSLGIQQQIDQHRIHIPHPSSQFSGPVPNPMYHVEQPTLSQEQLNQLMNPFDGADAPITDEEIISTVSSAVDSSTNRYLQPIIEFTQEQSLILSKARRFGSNVSASFRKLFHGD